MRTADFIAAAPRLGCTFKKTGTGDPRWTRLLVIRPDGVTVGRLSFKDDVLTNNKEYKSRAYSMPIDESDRVYAAVSYFEFTGEFLEGFDAMVEQARREVAEDLARKKEARKKLPVKKRPKLMGRDPRLVMYDILRRKIDARRQTEATRSAGAQDNEIVVHSEGHGDVPVSRCAAQALNAGQCHGQPVGR